MKRKYKTKKAKPKMITDKDKERVEFARRHWDEHHGKGAAKAEDSDMWTVAAYIPGSSKEVDTPQP